MGANTTPKISHKTILFFRFCNIGVRLAHFLFIALLTGLLVSSLFSQNTSVNYGQLLKDIVNDRKKLKNKASSSSVSYQLIEETKALAFNVTENKILFLKVILENKKHKQELILFDSQKKTFTHYRFSNPRDYIEKKNELINTHDLISGLLFGTAVESEMVRHRLLPTDLLLVRDEGMTFGKKDTEQILFPGLQIYLNNDRERYLTGFIRINQVLINPIKVKRMFLSTTGRTMVLLISYKYIKKNKIFHQERLLGFDLYNIIKDPNLKVFAENEFELDEAQQSLIFQTNYFYNGRDELLYTEELYHSGIKNVFGDGFYLF